MNACRAMEERTSAEQTVSHTKEKRSRTGMHSMIPPFCGVEDLTLQFIRNRALFKHSRHIVEFNQPTIENSNVNRDVCNTPYLAIEFNNHSQLLTPWLDAVEECQEDLESVKKLLLDLDTASQHHSSSPLKQSYSRESNSRPVESLGKAYQILKRCQERLPQIEAEIYDSSSTESQLREKIHVGLALKIKKLSDLARSRYAQLLSKKMTEDVVHGDQLCCNKLALVQEDSVNYDTSAENKEAINQSAVCEMQYDIPSQDLKEAAHLMKTAEEVQCIFSHIGSLVELQGTILDRIDYSIEQGMQDVQKGANELVNAEHKRLRRRGFRFILFLCGFDFFLIILLILKIRRWE